MYTNQINCNPISHLYYQNLKSIIFDQTTKKVDISKLRPFDWQNPHDRISPAWINALGQHVRSYDEAKNSFINLGLVRNFYADTCGKLYLTYEEAEAVNKKGVKFDEIAYYEVEDSANDPKIELIEETKKSYKMKITGDKDKVKKSSFENKVLEFMSDMTEFVKEQKEFNNSVIDFIKEQKEFNQKVDQRLNIIEDKLDIIQSLPTIKRELKNIK